MLEKIVKNFHWQRNADKNGPRRLVVLELGPGQVKIVELERSGQVVGWKHKQVRRSPATANEPKLVESLHAALEQIERPPQYVSLLLDGVGEVVRLLNFPGQPPASSDAQAVQVKKILGVDESYTIRHLLVNRSEDSSAGPRSEEPVAPPEQEYAVVAAAIRRELVETFRLAVVKAGLTPVGLMPLGIAFANLAAARMAYENQAESTIGFISISSYSSLLLVYSQQQLILARQFKTGFHSLVEVLMKSLELDEKMAVEILYSGSFDLSGNLNASVSNWIHQVGISLDFIERRFGRHLEKLFFLCDQGSAKVLDKILADSLNCPVEQWSGFKFPGTNNLQAENGDRVATAEYACALCEGMRIMQPGLKNGI